MSIGLLDEILTEVYKPRFRRHGDMIICSLNVVEHKQIQVVFIRILSCLSMIYAIARLNILGMLLI